MGISTYKVNWPRRVLRTVLGLLLCLVGLAMVVLPGPAWVFLPAGLAVLALEHEFARRWLLSVRRWVSSGAREHRVRNRT